MKKILIMAAAAMVAACSNSNTDSNTQPAACGESASTAILGEWNIANIVENDSTNVRPDEMAPPGRPQHFTFDTDSTFGITTNCNSLGGTYTLRGDSITFIDIMQTEMACDDMAAEQLLSRILPHVAAIDLINDSTLRLNTSAEAYIILSRPNRQPDTEKISEID